MTKCFANNNVSCGLFRYCDSAYAFPPQKDVVAFAVNKSVQFLQSHSQGVIVVGSYTIGKERIFVGTNIHGLDKNLYWGRRVERLN